MVLTVQDIWIIAFLEKRFLIVMPSQSLKMIENATIIDMYMFVVGCGAVDYPLASCMLVHFLEI